MNPVDANSAGYERTIPIFMKGSPEEWIDWTKNVQREIMGQNATTGAAKYAFARRLLEDGALKAFENAAHVMGGKTNNHYKLVIKVITVDIVPKKALQQQKQYIQGCLKILFGMNVKDFMEQVIAMNELLTLFPDPSLSCGNQDSIGQDS